MKENYQRLAEAVIRAVADYKGFNYVPPEGFISNSYTVQKGDTLYGIANKLGTTVSELKNTNNLTSDTLSIGQVLKIPNSNNEENSNTITYTVKSGDSLYSIAKNYDVTVDAIKKENNLTSNLLSIGQILIIE